jgi:hypothetical protein
MRCGNPIARAAGRGRPRSYCSAACRKAAQRVRAAAWQWMEGDDDAQLAPWANDGLETLDDVCGPRHAPAGAVPSPGQSTPDDVTQTLLALSGVRSEFRRHAVAAPPRIAAKCGALADAIDAGLTASFGEVFV